jgi:hypothetical protein
MFFFFGGGESIPILFAPKIAWISHFVVNHTNEMKLGLGGGTWALIWGVHTNINTNVAIFCVC